MTGHRWRVAYSILIRDRSRLDLGVPSTWPARDVDELLVPSHPDSLAFAFDAPTAADAIEMAGVKLQEYRRTRLHQAGEFICAFRMVDVEWLGPESPGAAGDGSSPTASDDLLHLPNPLQHEPPNGDT
jgi:hypothetical protein